MSIAKSMARVEASAAALSQPKAEPALTLSEAVDELGAVKGQIAALQEREKTLRDILVASGEPKPQGTAYDASVSHSEREGRDDVFKARIEELVTEHLSRQFVTAHTTSTPVVTVRVVAKRGAR